MFISENLAFLEMQKTGCSHIRLTLNDILEGELVGKHNQANPELFNGQRFFLGSVRNPWSWYVSLWGFGCDQKGAVHSNLTRAAVSGKSQLWKATYKDKNDASAFREWLHMLNDERYQVDLGEGFARSPVSKVAGLMTFRYLTLFSTKSSEKKALNGLFTNQQIKEYDEKNCFIDFFIKNESLSEDLLKFLTDFDLQVSEQVKKSIMLRPKTNASSKKKGLDFYYNDETLRLVAEKESLIIDKFGYQLPNGVSYQNPNLDPMKHHMNKDKQRIQELEGQLASVHKDVHKLKIALAKVLQNG